MLFVSLVDLFRGEGNVWRVSRLKRGLLNEFIFMRHHSIVPIERTVLDLGKCLLPPSMLNYLSHAFGSRFLCDATNESVA